MDSVRSTTANLTAMIFPSWKFKGPVATKSQNESFHNYLSAEVPRKPRGVVALAPMPLRSSADSIVRSIRETGIK